ncbi:MAG: hypothetical protein AB1779_09495 [Candidatus Thermoplasmatota archaeon]
MRIEFEIDGQKYSKNKQFFKSLLKKYAFKWKGTMQAPKWEGKDEVVYGIYDRDEIKDITLSAKLIWVGKKRTGFLMELEKWVKDLSGKVGKIGEKTKNLLKERELKIWDAIYKPDVTLLEAMGRPKKWIMKDIEEWKKKRRIKIAELSKEK